MSLFDRLQDLLRNEGARFRVLEHPAEGRSDEVARIRGTLPGQGAKAMLCRSKDDAGVFVLAVLPGDRKLDFRKVAQAVGLKKVTLASPEEATREMGAAIGAIPPFTFPIGCGSSSIRRSCKPTTRSLSTRDASIARWCWTRRTSCGSPSHCCTT